MLNSLNFILMIWLLGYACLILIPQRLLDTNMPQEPWKGKNKDHWTNLCRRNELPVSGTKKQLWERLQEAGAFDTENQTGNGHATDDDSQTQTTILTTDENNQAQTTAVLTTASQAVNTTGQPGNNGTEGNTGGLVTDSNLNQRVSSDGSLGSEEKIDQMYWWFRRIGWLVLILLAIAGFTLSYTLLSRFIPRIAAGTSLVVVLVIAGLFLFAKRENQTAFRYCVAVLAVIPFVLSLIPIYERVTGKLLIPEMKAESLPKCVLVVLPSAEDHLLDLKENGGKGDESVSFDIVKGIKEKLDPLPSSPSGLGLKIGEENINYLFINDGPNHSDTVSRIVDQTKKNDVLLVLGHETSTAAKMVWTEFYQHNEIPVVLLGPTNPTITKDDAARAKVLLRLMPNDNQQVARIIDILNEDFEVGQRNVLLVTDSGNPIYSNYIGERIIDRLPRNCQFCGSLQVSSVNSLGPDWERIVKRHKPNTVIFVGMSQAAKSFLLSLHHSPANSANADAVPQDEANIIGWLKGVDFIFTDGCASNGFCNFLKDSELTFRNFYVVSTASSDRDDFTLGQFNFEQIGYASVAFSYRLLFDSMERNGGSDLSTSGVLSELRLQSTPPLERVELDKVPGDISSNLREDLRALQFDVFGDNTEWQWHVFRKSPDERDFIQLGQEKDE